MQSEMDRALLRVVTVALEALPVGAATVSQQWVEGAGMWFVKERPRLAAAARFDVGYDAADLLNVTVGNIWFEVPVTFARWTARAWRSTISGETAAAAQRCEN